MSLRSALAYGSGWLRLATGLPAFLRHPISVDEARTWVLRRMQEREDVFLDKLEHAVFANRRSPYLALLQAAGCTRGDVERMVRQDGVEDGGVARYAAALEDVVRRRRG